MNKELRKPLEIEHDSEGVKLTLHFESAPDQDLVPPLQTIISGLTEMIDASTRMGMTSIVALWHIHHALMAANANCKELLHRSLSGEEAGVLDEFLKLLESDENPYTPSSE